MRKLLFLLIINALCVPSSYADKIYKRAPFELTITATDTIIAEYNLSEHRGLYCSASNKHFLVSFTYKGRNKTATLPVTLQNYRVPVDSREELADTTGTIELMAKAGQPAKVEISCQYNN